MTKAEGGRPVQTELTPDTKVTIGSRNPHAHHGFVNAPVYHASTLLYRTAEDFLARRGPYAYGRLGTPTSEALEQAIQAIEGPACAGYESLAIPVDVEGYRTATEWAPGGLCIRLHIGLEDVDDLIADLERGFAALAVTK